MHLCQWNRPVLHTDESGRHKMLVLFLWTLFVVLFYLPAVYFIYMQIHTSTCMSTNPCIYIHIHAHMYLHTHIHMYIHKNHTQNMDIFSKEARTLIISQKATLCNMNLLFLSFLPLFHHSLLISSFLYFFKAFDPLPSPLDLFITHLFH